jgi:hypothetical protein
MRTHECILLVTNQSSKLDYNMNEVLRLDGRLLATGGKRFASHSMSVAD